jgi:hypothetical protein
MAVILKILKTKSTTLSDDLFLGQVSNGYTVRFEFNIFCTLVTIRTAAILNLLNLQKLPHTYGGYSYKGGHFEPNMAAKIQKSSDFWAKFGFQVDYDVAN